MNLSQWSAILLWAGAVCFFVGATINLVLVLRT